MNRLSYLSLALSRSVQHEVLGPRIDIIAISVRHDADNLRHRILDVVLQPV
ncbi:hypothetical protein JZ785_22370 [Alicyclobacillus curvatus]|nr:hypothetical protein JZ785_22370 [Alicyclobacillus curvatus]